MLIENLVVTKDGYHFNLLKDAWIKQGIQPVLATSMQEAINMIVEKDYVLININACDIDYLPLLKIMREITPTLILVFTEKFSHEQHREATRKGADHYLEWHPNIEESVIHSAALFKLYLERNKQPKPPVKYIYSYGITLYPIYHKAFIQDKEIRLSRREFDILHMLIANPNRIFTGKQIMKRVWGDEYDEADTALLWSAIKRLRKKLKVSSDFPDYIKNVRDVGYRFDKE